MSIVSRIRNWLGPLLIGTAGLQFRLGQLLLAHFHPRPLNVIGLISVAVIMTSTLTFIAGLGESFDWIAARFSNRT